MSEGFDRRAFLRRAGLGGLVLAVPASGYAGYRYPWWQDARGEAPEDEQVHAGEADAEMSDSREHTYVSRPDLRPPRITVTHVSGALPAGYVFLAPKGYNEEGPGQEGCLIADATGEPVWFAPRTDGDVVMGFRTQTYRGKPVLTWWRGEVDRGYGHGTGLVYDSSYRQITEVRAAGGESVDLHEFRLTDRGTALITCYGKRPADLTAVGGPADGYLLEGIIQELDVATGQLVMQWNSLDHVPLEQTMQPFGNGDGAGENGDETAGTSETPFDYIHLNSINVDGDGDLIVSARNTCAVYKIARDGSAVHWRIGGVPGAATDFTVAEDARFSWQHDAVAHPDGTISLFDNSSAAESDQSRGMLLNVDPRARTVTLRTGFTHPSMLRCDNQGSMQVQPDGGAFVGWGAQPYFSLFTPDGELRWDARLPHQEQTYRAYLDEWEGAPAADDAPAVAVREQDAGGAAVFASWNGATQVRSWRILAGEHRDSLAPVLDVPRAGFETLAVVSAEGPWYAAVALDGRGAELGRSAPVVDAG